MMESLVNLSARANAFSIAQLLESSQVDAADFVTDSRGMFGRWTSPQQMEKELEGKVIYSFSCILLEEALISSGLGKAE